MEELDKIVDKLMEEIVRPTTKPRKQKVEVEVITPNQEDQGDNGILQQP